MSSNIAEAKARVLALKEEIEKTKVSISELEHLLFRYIALARRCGLPDDAVQAIALIQRLISIVKMLRVSLAILTATTPIGWINLLTGLGGLLMVTAVTADMVQEMG